MGTPPSLLLLPGGEGSEKGASHSLAPPPPFPQREPKFDLPPDAVKYLTDSVRARAISIVKSHEKGFALKKEEEEEEAYK